MTDEPISDQQRAEQFVQQILAAVQQATCRRTVIAAAFFEVAGALARQDVLEDESLLTFYAEALQVLDAHVLGPLPVRSEGKH